MAEQIKLETIGLGEILVTLIKLQTEIQSTSDELSNVVNNLDWEVKEKQNVEGKINNSKKTLLAQKETLNQMEMVVKRAIEKSDGFNDDFVKRAMGIITSIIALVSSYFPGSMNGITQNLTKIKDWLCESNNKSTLGGRTSNNDANNLGGVSDGGYGGEVKHIVAYNKDKKYDKTIWPSNEYENIWKNGYAGTKGCGVASLAMAFSSLGVDITPKEIMSKNIKTNPEKLTADAYDPASYPIAKGVRDVSGEVNANLDVALRRYKENPGVYSAPMVWLKFQGMAHAVVVTDLNPDGTYKILDPSGNNIPTLKLSENIPTWSDDKKDKVFNTSYSAVRQYKKGA